MGPVHRDQGEGRRSRRHARGEAAAGPLPRVVRDRRRERAQQDLAPDPRALLRAGVHDRHRRRRAAAGSRESQAAQRAGPGRLQLGPRRLLRDLSPRDLLAHARRQSAGGDAGAEGLSGGRGPMFQYVVRRILIMIPTLIVISIVIFTIMKLPPGDYFTTYIETLRASGESVDQQKVEFLRQQYHFDDPAWRQYLYWAGGLIQGDLGYSFEHDLPVSAVVGDRLLLTAIVSIATIIFTWVVAFPIGVSSATHQYSWSDYSLTFLGFLGLATPNFLLALVLLYLANIYFGLSIGGLMEPQYLDKPW